MWRTDSLKRPWCWERLKAGGKEDDKGWNHWQASPTQWTWVWVNSGVCWWTGRHGVLQFMGSTEFHTTEWLNWTELGLFSFPVAWCEVKLLGVIAIMARPPSKGLIPALLAPSTAVFSAPDPAAGHCWPLPPLDPWTLTGKSGSVFCGVTDPSSRVLVNRRFCFCLPRVCFSSPVEVP